MDWLIILILCVVLLCWAGWKFKNLFLILRERISPLRRRTNKDKEKEPLYFINKSSKEDIIKNLTWLRKRYGDFKKALLMLLSLVVASSIANMLQDDNSFREYFSLLSPLFLLIGIFWLYFAMVDVGKILKEYGKMKMSPHSWATLCLMIPILNLVLIFSLSKRAIKLVRTLEEKSKNE